MTDIRVSPDVTTTMGERAEVELDDAVLWDAAVSGDRSGFHELYRRHAPRVHRVCQRLGLPPHEAEDVVSETFLAAWNTRHDLTVGPSGMAPWLIVVATNLTRKRFRGRSRQTAAVRRLSGQSPITAPDHAELLADSAQHRDNVALAHRSLQLLSPTDQELIALCILANIAPGDVARSRGVPAATVRSQLSRARRRLQRQYQELSHDEDSR